MGRRLVPPLLVLFLLLAPGAAQAAKKKLKVPSPSDGNISVRGYKVTVKGADAPKVSIVKSSLHGGQAIVSVTKVKRHVYELGIYAVNPTSGATAAQQAPFVFKIKGIGTLTIKELWDIPDLLDAELANYESIEKFCKSRSARVDLKKKLIAAGIPRTEASNIVKALRRYLCQDGTIAQRVAAWQTLEDLLDTDLPSCFGVISGFQGGTMEIVTSLVCMRPTQQVGLTGPAGSEGTNCLGPPGSFCNSGPGCSQFDPSRSVCFNSPGGFPMGTELQFNARFNQSVFDGDIPQVTGLSAPPGATSPGEFQHIFVVG
jgi:hypothetical protein